VTVVIPRKAVHRILWWTRCVFFAGGLAMLGYCAFVLSDAWIFQNREGRQFDRLLTERRDAIPVAASSSGLIGRIEIQRLGLSAMVIEGMNDSTLRRAVGHIPGTALPGQMGNVAISGHRDTFFRPLRNIKRNDIITLTTLSGVYQYRVVSTKVVGSNDVSVLTSNGRQILTLVTCYPFYFVGSAPDRFIVRAERVT